MFVSFALKKMALLLQSKWYVKGEFKYLGPSQQINFDFITSLYIHRRNSLFEIPKHMNSVILQLTNDHANILRFYGILFLHNLV